MSRPYPVILLNESSNTWESRNIPSTLLEEMDQREDHRIAEVALKLADPDLIAYSYCFLPSGITPHFGEVSTPTEKFVHSDAFDPRDPDGYERANWQMPETTLYMPLDQAIAASPRHIAKARMGLYRLYVGPAAQTGRFYIALKFHAVSSYILMMEQGTMMDVALWLRAMGQQPLGWESVQEVK